MGRKQHLLGENPPFGGMTTFWGITLCLCVKTKKTSFSPPKILAEAPWACASQGWGSPRGWSASAGPGWRWAGGRRPRKDHPVWCDKKNEGPKGRRFLALPGLGPCNLFVKLALICMLEGVRKRRAAAGNRSRTLWRTAPCPKAEANTFKLRLPCYLHAKS